MAHVALADQGQELSHPKTWIGMYVWSQDHKVIGIQYIITATAVGLVALFLSAQMRLQLGFPGVFDFVQPNEYYSAVTMHGMIMVVFMLTAFFLGGFGNLLIPLMCGARAFFAYGRSGNVVITLSFSASSFRLGAVAYEQHETFQYLNCA